MKTRLTKLILSLAVVVLFAMSQAQAAVVTVGIDNFASGVPLSTYGTTSASNDGLHAGVLGGYRGTSVVAFTGGLNVFYSPVIGNTLAFDALGGSAGAYSALYDGVGVGGTLNYDLLGANSAGAFSLRVPVANGAGTAFVTVIDNSNNTYTTGQNILLGVPNQDLNFDYADYLGNGVDLTDIKSIGLTISSSGVAADFTVGAFSAVTSVVPEPATLSLLGLGGLLILRRRRRQRIV